MKNFKNYINTLFLMLLSVLIVALFVITFFTVKINKYEQNQILLEDFFSQILFKDGAILTNPGNKEFNAEYATGDQVLSESQGLMMQYCLLKNDQSNFNKTFNFVESNMLINNFISYRMITEGELSYVTSSVDDFRIVGALLEAEKKWNDPVCKDKAIEHSDTMYYSIVHENKIVDFYDITYSLPGNSLTLCYADFKTIKMLINENLKWQPVFDNSLKIVREGYLSDTFPCYATSYNYVTETYDTKKINMVQTLITAINLSEIDCCPKQTVEFIEKKVKAKSLYGSYSSTGEALDKINSTAVYALAAILGKKTGNIQLEEAALEVMIEFQVLDKQNELYGGFADVNTGDAFSFDNLNALIALQMTSD